MPEEWVNNKLFSCPEQKFLSAYMEEEKEGEGEMWKDVNVVILPSIVNVYMCVCMHNFSFE